MGDHGRYMIISALGADYQRLRGDRNIRLIHRDGRTSRDIYLNSQPGPPGGALHMEGPSLAAPPNRRNPYDAIGDLQGFRYRQIPGRPPGEIYRAKAELQPPSPGSCIGEMLESGF